MLKYELRDVMSNADVLRIILKCAHDLKDQGTCLRIVDQMRDPLHRAYLAEIDDPDLLCPICHGIGSIIGKDGSCRCPDGWQLQHIDPDTGPGPWKYIEANEVEHYRSRPNNRVRALYAESV